MSSPHRRLLPEGLADIPPGPRLAAALGAIEPECLTAGDAEIYLRVCYRQVSHDQARFMEAMVWFGLCRPAPDDVVAHDREPSPAASDEVRASLRWTRQATEKQFYLALDLRDRLPRVQQALWEGRIDLPRARVLAEWTLELTLEQAQRICGALLPDAPTMTTGELVATVKQMAIAIDPDWAKRRYEEAVRSRRVVGHRNCDGTANLSGIGLPLDETAAASARIEALARQVKKAGDGRRIDQIRADLSAPRGALAYPRFSREELGRRFLGLMAYLDPKGEGDNSMPGKQRSCSGVWGDALWDPHDMAKA